MNKWMKMGIAGVALAGSLQAAAEETPPEDTQYLSNASVSDDSGFSIEASDLIAKKLRDYVKIEEVL